MEEHVEKKIIELEKEGIVSGLVIRHCRYFITRMNNGYSATRRHSMRVALMAHEVGHRMYKDPAICFISGLLHDIGKIKLDPKLFDGHNFTDDMEYETVKKHSIFGFNLLFKLNLDIALIVGLVHMLCENGYGITRDDFPSDFGLVRTKKVLDIAIIIAVCDYIDSVFNRKTECRDKKNGNGSNTALERLLEKYPNDRLSIEHGLCVFGELNLPREEE